MTNDLEAVKGHQFFIPTLVHYSVAFVAFLTSNGAVLVNLASEWYVVLCLVLSMYSVIFVFHCPNYSVNLSVVPPFATK